MNCIKKSSIIALAAVALIGCERAGDGETYQVINKDADGKILILNQKTGRLTIVSKSNRIDDILELDIKDADVNGIKKKKEDQDKLLKVRAWGVQKIANTPYKVALSTRHYKDKLLYTLSFSDADDTTSYKARTISINLRDANGFVLEKIVPTSWVTVVNEEGKPQIEQASGEIPMTLDNYLEISAYDPNWTRNLR